MRKVIIRGVSVIFIALCIVMMILPAWISIDGVKSSAWRKNKDFFASGLDKIEENLLFYLEDPYYSAEIKDELKDNKLPYKKADIKEKLGTVQDLVKETLNDKIYLSEIFSLAITGPELIKTVGNALEVKDRYSSALFYSDDFLDKSDLDDFYDDIKNISFIFWIIIGIAALYGLLALATAVTEIIGKLTFFKYIFFVFVLILAATFIALPFIVNGALGDLGLSKSFSDISLSVTFAPFVCIICAFWPILSRICLKKYETKPAQN